MASHGSLDVARRLLLALDCAQSQAGLNGQASDCAPIVEALGYYDLADHLRHMAGLAA